MFCITICDEQSIIFFFHFIVFYFPIQYFFCQLNKKKKKEKKRCKDQKTKIWELIETRDFSSFIQSYYYSELK